MGLRDLVAAARGLGRADAARAVVVESAELAVFRQRISGDIIDLLWFSDGPLRNCESKHSFESSSAFEGVRLTVSFFGDSEPSAISLGLPVKAPQDLLDVEKLGYYPSYGGMSPYQRWVYLNWLVDVDAAVDIGYVFVFYYGLERHLFGGRADQAVDAILRLRVHHPHSSFIHYSSDAIIAASLVANRPDWMSKFALTLNSATDVALSDVYLFAKYLYGFSLSAPELMALASRVGFSNRRHMKNEPVLFEAALERALLDRYGESGLLLSNYPVERIPESKFPVCANYSLDRDSALLKVPAFNELPSFVADINTLLTTAHGDVKQHLKEMRASQRSAESPESVG